MVRKVELNCRNGWAADLWEPAPDGEGQPVDPADAPFAALAEGGAALAELERLPPLTAEVGATETTSTLGVDVLVDQSPSPRSASSGSADVGRDDAEERPDHRELIIRARDINRIRQANRTRPTLAPIGVPDGDRPAPPDTGSTDAGRAIEPDWFRPITVAAPGTEPGDRTSGQAIGRDEPVSADREALAARLASLVPVPPVPSTELRTDLLGFGANRAEAESRFETVPPVDPTFTLPFRDRGEATPLRAGFGGDDPFDAPVVADRRGSFEPEEPSQPAQMSSSAMAGGTSPEDQARSLPGPAGDDRERGRRWSRDRRATHREMPDVAPAPDASPQLAAPSASRPTSDESGTDWPVAVGPIVRAEPERDLSRDQELRPAITRDPALVGAAEEEVTIGEASLSFASSAEPALVDDPTYLPGVLRCCRTCRDFRPAEGGERGWCTNRWAFQHRRMVHDDEMPCWGAVGSWWVPHDDVWLDEWDVDHVHPTPLVETMLAKLASVTSAPAAPRLRRRGRT